MTDTNLPGAVHHETVELASDPGGLLDLRARLSEKADLLEAAMPRAHGTNHWRLQGKADGIRLALSFVEEAIRERA